MDPTECPHDDFDFFVSVNKLEDANTISVDVSGVCKGCGARLSFTGMKGGIHPTEPRVSPFGAEARLPAKLFHRDYHTGQYDVRNSE